MNDRLLHQKKAIALVQKAKLANEDAKHFNALFTQQIIYHRKIMSELTLFDLNSSKELVQELNSEKTKLIIGGRIPIPTPIPRPNPNPRPQPCPSLMPQRFCELLNLE